MQMKISEKLYKGLSKFQHTENNKWFETMYQLTNMNGFLLLTNIGVVLQKSESGWIKYERNN